MRTRRGQTNRRLKMSLLLVVMFIAASSFHAQSTPQSAPPKNEQHSASITSRINAVLVPVVVTDKNGNHVRGLTREDFTLRENGKDRPVASFEEIVAQAEPIHLTPPSATKFTNQFDQPGAKGLEIIALDMINTPFLHQAEARDAVIKFLSTAASRKAVTALVVLEPNGVKFVHNFTSDPKVLVAAIQKVQSRLTARDTTSLDVHLSGVMDGPGTIFGDTGSEDDAEAMQLSMILGGAAASGGSGIGVMAAESMEAQAKMDAAREGRESQNTLGSIEQLAKYFGGVPGRKSLIWASTGFRLMNHEMAGGFGGGTTAEDWLQTVRALQDADIAVYSVDIGGLMATPRAVTATAVTQTRGPLDSGVAGKSAAMQAFEAGLFTDPIEGKHNTLRKMSEETGGQALYNFNDLENLIKKAVDDSSQYYMLTFYANDKGKEGWHKLEVKVKREGAQARGRDGFYYAGPAGDLDSSRRTDEVQALKSPFNFLALPITATWLSVDRGTEKRGVHFSLAVAPGAVLIDAAHENHVSVDFLAVALDGQGNPAGQASQRIDKNLQPADVKDVEGGGMNYVGLLPLAPGDYQVHLVVRDNLTGKIGSVIAFLKLD